MGTQTHDRPLGNLDLRRGGFILRRRELMVSLVGLTIAACRSAELPPTAGQRITERGTTMKLESSAFEADQAIPINYTCDGADRSPPLRWDGPPEGTKSWVLICDDPDAPRGTWVHWVVYDLPPELRQLPEGVPPQPMLAEGGVHGMTDFRRLGYGGPCPPGGTHRYFFKLYALDRRLDLQPGATKAQIEQAMEGHILGKAELMGRYARQR